MFAFHDMSSLSAFDKPIHIASRTEHDYIPAPIWATLVMARKFDKKDLNNSACSFGTSRYIASRQLLRFHTFYVSGDPRAFWNDILWISARIYRGQTFPKRVL
jgi:hypothetical protein